MTSSPTIPLLMAQDGLTAEEATALLDRQGAIQSYLETSGVTQRPDFLDLVVRPKPYQIILTFGKDVRVNEIIASVPNELRRFVKVRKAKHDKSGRRNAIATLTNAFKIAGADFAVGYNADAERYFVDTADAATTSRLKPLIPSALAGEVDLLTGALPEQTSDPNAVPTGVRSGDWAVAGWGNRTVGSGFPCTLGFTITFGTNLQGILTASHCTEPKEVDRGTHKYVFPDTYYQSSTAQNHDYAIYRTDGLLTDYRVYYRNTKSTPGYSSQGWLSVKNFIRHANQWVGMYTCKMGTTTGLTCAKSISTTYDWKRTGSSEWLRLSSTTTVAEGGDSGGPAFVTLDSSRPSEITAAGILAGGGGPYATVNYTAVVMPIDRAFDHVSNVRLKTTP
ncbi:chymotrypsin family serine protease [Alteripontixanthobacter maritimus]|uniref:hypothetical protein n=1 Tax=Alteripontixanthobacter maritimus TaxID=2161824 RepID=UPI0011C05F5C|nr:hypothetical protein [Alteripontixanthobacter maritimus]